MKPVAQDRLRRLTQLTGLARHQAEQALASAAQKAQTLEQQIDGLDTDRRAVLAADPGPAQAVGADLLWLQMSERCRADLQARLARARVQQEICRRKAQRVVARDIVAGKIAAHQSGRR